MLDIATTNGNVKVGEVNTSIFHQQSSIHHLQVLPNPFSNSTNIIFEIPQAENVRIVIYDLLGKEVRLFNRNYAAGKHSLEWNGTDNQGMPLSKGLYHIRMMAGSYSGSQKVLLMK